MYTKLIACKRAACFSMLAVTVCWALAGEPASLPEQYRQVTQGGVFVCGLAAQAYRAGYMFDPPDDYNKCVAEWKTKSKALFDATGARLKKQKAREALKRYHAAFLAAMLATDPASFSTTTFDAATAKMNDAWGLYEVEL